MTPTADQLGQILEEIRQIEESPGFEGPKIATPLIIFGEVLIEAFPSAGEDLRQDYVVGAIGRACDVLGWNCFMDIVNSDERFEVEIFSEDFGELVRNSETSLALAAAMAYRDALEAVMK